MYGVHQAADPAISPMETRGPCELQEEPVGERPVKRTTPRSSNNKRADEGSRPGTLSPLSTPVET